MMSKIQSLRVILLFLIIILLISITYFALDISTYLAGDWRLVQGENLEKLDFDPQSVVVQVGEKKSYPPEYWNVISHGELFFKPKPVLKEPQLPNSQTEEPAINLSPEKPTCPWTVSGVIVGQKNKAILVNIENQFSQTVEVGFRLQEFIVSEITVDYVLLKSSKAEFRLELGGK